MLRVPATHNAKQQTKQQQQPQRQQQSRQRKFEDMSPADQGLLEDFDTEQLAKRRKKIYVQRPLAFRSHVSEAAAGAEHGAASSSASVNAKNPPV